MPKVNPIYNRKRVLEIFKDEGVTLSMDAREILADHMESFFRELALCFDEGSKVSADEMTEAYELMVPEPPEEGEETEQVTSESEPALDPSEDNGYKRFKMLRPDVIKHAFALNELIIEEGKVIAKELSY